MSNVISNVLYNTAVLPRWDGTDAPPQPSLANNKGYDVTAPQLTPASRNATYQRANGNLCNGHFWWPLFITDVSMDIALSGFTAQSRMTRDFYPHNFTQPNFAVKGQAIDQRDYGTLTDFVHYAQRSSLINNGQLMQLYIKGWGYQGNRHSSRGVKWGNKHYSNELIRGPHQSILCQGYVNQMPRQHQKSVYAPEYTFSFVVADEILGPFHENLVLNTQQATWVDILKSTDTFKVNQALLKENNEILTWAKNNSANIFNTGNTGSNTGNSGTGNSNDPQIVTGLTPPHGLAWQVQASQESNDLAANSGPGCGSHTTSESLNGWSELQNCGSLGGVPCDTELYIQNDGNRTTVRAKKVDCGGGSSFNPVIGLYPATSQLLGLSGGQYSVTIWRVDGQPLHVASGGTPV